MSTRGKILSSILIGFAVPLLLLGMIEAFIMVFHGLSEFMAFLGAGACFATAFYILNTIA